MTAKEYLAKHTVVRDMVEAAVSKAKASAADPHKAIKSLKKALDKKYETNFPLNIVEEFWIA